MKKGPQPEQILSTTLSTKFANDQKLDDLSEFVDEFTRIVQIFINDLWPKALRGERIPSQFRADERPKIETWFLERAVILAIQQASSVVRGIKKALKKREDRLAWLKDVHPDELEEIEKQRQSVEKSKAVPQFSGKGCNLSSKVGSLCKSINSFDQWVVIHDFDRRAKGRKIQFPVKLHKHFRALVRRGGSLRSE